MGVRTRPAWQTILSYPGSWWPQETKPSNPETLRTRSQRWAVGSESQSLLSERRHAVEPDQVCPNLNANSLSEAKPDKPGSKSGKAGFNMFCVALLEAGERKLATLTQRHLQPRNILK